MLSEISSKGGFDEPRETMSSSMLQQSAIGKRYFSGALLPKDTDIDQLDFDARQFVPSNGWLPVNSLSRAINLIEKSYARKHPNMAPSQVRKRPRYTIDPKIDKSIDSLFENVIRPRQTILDSEEVALKQLQEAAGISVRGPFTLPMQDKYLEGVHKTIKGSEEQGLMLQNRGVGQPLLGYQAVDAPIPAVVRERVIERAAAPIDGVRIPAEQVDARIEGRINLALDPAQIRLQLNNDKNVPLNVQLINGRNLKFNVPSIDLADKNIDVPIINMGKARFVAPPLDFNKKQFQFNITGLGPENFVAPEVNLADQAFQLKFAPGGQPTFVQGNDIPIDLSQQQINLAPFGRPQINVVNPDIDLSGEVMSVRPKGRPKLTGLSHDLDLSGETFNIRPVNKPRILGLDDRQLDLGQESVRVNLQGKPKVLGLNDQNLNLSQEVLKFNVSGKPQIQGLEEQKLDFSDQVIPVVPPKIKWSAPDWQKYWAEQDYDSLSFTLQPPEFEFLMDTQPVKTFPVKAPQFNYFLQDDPQKNPDNVQFNIKAPTFNYTIDGQALSGQPINVPIQAGTVEQLGKTYQQLATIGTALTGAMQNQTQVTTQLGQVTQQLLTGMQNMPMQLLAQQQKIAPQAVNMTLPPPAPVQPPPQTASILPQVAQQTKAAAITQATATPGKPQGETKMGDDLMEQPADTDAFSIGKKSKTSEGPANNAEKLFGRTASLNARSSRLVEERKSETRKQLVNQKRGISQAKQQFDTQGRAIPNTTNPDQATTHPINPLGGKTYGGVMKFMGKQVALTDSSAGSDFATPKGSMSRGSKGKSQAASSEWEVDSQDYDKLGQVELPELQLTPGDTTAPDVGALPPREIGDLTTYKVEKRGNKYISVQNKRDISMSTKNRGKTLQQLEPYDQQRVDEIMKKMLSSLSFQSAEVENVILNSTAPIDIQTDVTDKVVRALNTAQQYYQYMKKNGHTETLRSAKTNMMRVAHMIGEVQKVIEQVKQEYPPNTEFGAYTKQAKRDTIRQLKQSGQLQKKIKPQYEDQQRIGRFQSDTIKGARSKSRVNIQEGQNQYDPADSTARKSSTSRHRASTPGKGILKQGAGRAPGARGVSQESGF